MVNIEIILSKLFLKETYVYKTIIPFKKIGTNESSSFDALKNLNFVINNFFSLKDEFNKIILCLNTNIKAEIELLNIKNIKWKYEKTITNEKNLENMQNRMNELVNIIQM